MGIPGLTKTVLNAKRDVARTDLAGSDIYIDALNASSVLVDTITRIQTKNKKRALSTYEILETLAIKYIQFFVFAKPHSITIVYDAFVSEEKFKIRLSRIKRRITSKKPNMKISAILVRVIASRYPFINILYTGCEGEDGIMKTIDEDKSRGDRKQFIFSGDSDLFRFSISKPQHVEIVQLVRPKSYNSFIPAFNLGKVLELVPEKFVIKAPIKEPGKRYRSLGIYRRRLYEILNCAIVYKRVFCSLGLFSRTYTSELPDFKFADCGEFHRKLAYGLMKEKYGFITDPERGINFEEIEEWSQVGGDVVPSTVTPLNQTALKMAKEKLQNIDVVEIFESYFINFLDQHKLDLRIGYKVVNHIRDLSYDVHEDPVIGDIDCSDLDLSSIGLYTGLAKSLLSSLSFLNMLLPLGSSLPVVKTNFSVEGVINASADDNYEKYEEYRSLETMNTEQERKKHIKEIRKRKKANQVARLNAAEASNSKSTHEEVHKDTVDAETNNVSEKKTSAMILTEAISHLFDKDKIENASNKVKNQVKQKADSTIKEDSQPDSAKKVKNSKSAKKSQKTVRNKNTAQDKDTPGSTSDHNQSDSGSNSSTATNNTTMSAENPTKARRNQKKTSKKKSTKETVLSAQKNKSLDQTNTENKIDNNSASPEFAILSDEKHVEQAPRAPPLIQEQDVHKITKSETHPDRKPKKSNKDNTSVKGKADVEELLKILNI